MPDYPPSASYMCHEHGTTGNGRQSVRVLLNAPESSSDRKTEHEKRAVGEHSNRQIAPHDTACVTGHSEGFPKPGGRSRLVVSEAGKCLGQKYIDDHLVVVDLQGYPHVTDER